jgi:hypothetical protein
VRSQQRTFSSSCIEGSLAEVSSVANERDTQTDHAATQSKTECKTVQNNAKHCFVRFQESREYDNNTKQVFDKTAYKTRGTNTAYKTRGKKRKTCEHDHGLHRPSFFFHDFIDHVLEPLDTGSFFVVDLDLSLNGYPPACFGHIAVDISCQPNFASKASKKQKRTRGDK